VTDKRPDNLLGDHSGCRFRERENIAPAGGGLGQTLLPYLYALPPEGTSKIRVLERGMNFPDPDDIIILMEPHLVMRLGPIVILACGPDARTP
jgi:hypothetical protein